MKNTLAKDMLIQGKSFVKFYLKFACTIVWESIAQLITYMMGIKMEKLCLYGANPSQFFYQMRWVTVYVWMTLEVLLHGQEA